MKKIIATFVIALMLAAAAAWAANSAGVMRMSSTKGLEIGAPGVQFTSNDDVPSDGKLAAGRLYYDTTDGLSVYNGSAWSALATGGSGSLDMCYDYSSPGGGKTITVDSGDLEIDLSDSTNDYAVTVDVPVTGTINDAIKVTTSHASGVFTDGLDVSDAGIVNAISIGDNAIVGTAFNVTAATGAWTVSDDTASVTCSIASTHGDAAGVVLKLDHNSGTPADDDVSAAIHHYADDSGGTATAFSVIEFQTQDVTDTTEDSEIEFIVMKAGTATEELSISGESAVVIASGLTVTAGGETITAGTLTLSDGVITQTDALAATNPMLTLVNTHADAYGVEIKLNHDSASPADDDVAGRIRAYADDDGGTSTEMARIDFVADDVTNATEDGQIQFYVTDAGSAVKTLVIGAGTGSDVGYQVEVYSEDAGATGTGLKFQQNSSTPADDDVVGRISAYGDDSAGTSNALIRIDMVNDDVTDATEDGLMEIHVLDGGTLEKTMIFGGGTGSDVGDQVTFYSDDTGAVGAGFRMQQDQGTSAADNDVAARIGIYSDNDTGQATNIGKMDWLLEDASDASEDGTLQIHVMDGGTLEKTLIIGAGEDGADLGVQVAIFSDDVGAVGPGLKFHSDSASPAANDVAARIGSYADDDGGTSTQIGKIDFKQIDVAAASDDCEIEFHVMKAGTLTEVANIAASGLTIPVGTIVTSDGGMTITDNITTDLVVFDNTAGAIASGSTILELDAGGNIASGGSMLLFTPGGTPAAGSIAMKIAGGGKNIIGIDADVDAANNHGYSFNIGGATASAKAGFYIKHDGDPASGNEAVLHVEYSGTGTNDPVTAKFESSDAVNDVHVLVTNTGATGAILRMQQDQGTSAADNDVVSRIDIYSDNDTAQATNIAKIDFVLDDASDATEDGNIEFHVMDAGTLAKTVVIGAEGAGADAGAHVQIITTDTGATGAGILLTHDQGTSAADNDVAGRINIYSDNATAQSTNIARMDWTLEDATDATEDGSLTIYVMDGGALKKTLIVGVEGDGADDGANVQIYSEVDGTTGAGLKMVHNRGANQADNDVGARLDFYADDSGATETQYAKMDVIVEDETDASEDGTIEFHVMDGGTVERTLIIGGGRDGSDLGHQVEIYSNDTGAVGPGLRFNQEPGNSQQADADVVARIDIWGQDDATPATANQYAKLDFKATDSGAASEDGELEISLAKAGTLTKIVEFQSTGPIGGRVVALPFYEDDVAQNQTTATMSAAGGTGTTQIEYVMPWAGSVIGISVRSNEARTAQTATLDATIDGTATGLQAVLDGTNTQSHSATQADTLDTFTVNQRIGIKLTTHATWTPETADFQAVVWVQLY